MSVKSDAKKKHKKVMKALAAFANVPVTEEGHVYLYVSSEPDATMVKMRDGAMQPAHLHTNDFLLAQEVCDG